MQFKGLDNLLVILLVLASAQAIAQAAPDPIPAQPAPRHGKILDVSGDTVLADLATPLTVEFDALPAQQAAKAISQFGPMVIINGPYRNLDAQTVTLHLTDVPFIEGLMQLRQQLRARVSETSGSTVTLMYSPNEEVPPWCVAGPFAVMYCGISNELNFPVDYRTGETKPGQPIRRTILQLELAAEPGVNVMQSMQDVRITGLEDDKHQPIGVTAGEQRGIITHPGPVLELKLPPSPGRTIPLLKGTLDARIGQTLRAELANITEEQTPPPLQGMKIDVSSMVPQEGSATFYTVQVNYSRGTMAADRWAKIFTQLPTAKLKISGSGHGQISAFPPHAGRTGSPVKEDLQVQYRVIVAKGAGPPGAATLDVPMAVVDLRVPFEFDNVILP